MAQISTSTKSQVAAQLRSLLLVAMVEGEPVPSREPAALSLFAAKNVAWLVRLPHTALTLPAECACCGAPAARELRLEDGRDAALLVGYCEPCAVHLARDATRRLAAALSSLLLGLSLSAALPIVFPWQPQSVCVLAAGGFAVLPILLGRFGVRKREGHVGGAPAVVFRAPRELVCLRAAYATRVAEETALPVERVRAPRTFRWPELVLSVVSVVLVAPLSYSFHHPSVRVLELGAVATELFVDGRAVGRVEPSSGESPLAGLELRLPAGERNLVSVDPEGRAVRSARVALAAGRRHLYAPGSDGTCFWLETTSYGREQGRPDYVPLGGDERFWVLPEQVNGWFMPSPPAPEGARATGGSTTVLRQAPCDEAPYSNERGG